MKNLCVCVPTYNNIYNIKKYLDSQLELFRKENIDLYIYDSSEDEETEKYVKELQITENKNLFYVRKPSDMPSNIKVFHIFKEMSCSNYEYVWMIHDHTICTENALRYIIKAIETKSDFYVLNMQADKEKIHIFKNLDDFLLNSAWRLNSFGASILKTDSFLKNVDWRYMSDKYNDSLTMNYSHIGFYFERASEISDFSATEILFDRKDFIDFNRDKQINWSRDTLRICLECWGNVITKLPEVYANKIGVLRTQDRWFMSKYSLLTYRNKGYYGLSEFSKYGKWIKTIYPGDYIRDFMIAFLPYKVINRIISRKLYSSIRYIRENNGSIYIYGAGRHGVECGNYLKENDISFNGYMVSKKDGNPDKISDIPVVEIDSRYFDRNVLIIIAVLTSGIESVKKNIEKYSNNNTTIIVFGEE